MKKITIWDMDFYHKKSFQPNPIAMKISSFHKQKGHLVNFVTENFHINMSYDIFYIIKEKKLTPRPPGKLIDDDRVRLIGSHFRFFDNYYEVEPIISAVRPDYLLYPENPRDAYYNANLVQFYHNGKKLPKKQPFENTKTYHKKTLVVDKDFWEASEEDIVSCLIELKEHNNIAFLYPISLKKIIKSESIMNSFKELHFSQGTRFKFRNNYGQTFEHAKKLIAYISEVKELHSHVKFGIIPFKGLVQDHVQGGSEAGLEDFERCLKIIEEAKRKKVHIRIVSPQDRFESPFWYYFEILEYWTLYFERLSYVEIMLSSAMRRTGLPWYGIINNQMKWFTPNTYFLLTLMNKKKEWIENYGFRRWGENMLEYNLIDWEEVNKYSGNIQENLKTTEE